MEPEWEPAKSEVWAREVPGLAGRIRSESAGVADLIADRITGTMPELLTDPDMEATNLASTVANLNLLADLLEGGNDPKNLSLPEATRAFAVLGAHQNTPLPPLLRAYRVGHQAGWEAIHAMINELVADPEERDQLSEMVSSWLFAFIDAASCLAEIAYNDERERWIRTVSASRAETIATILEGGEIEAGTASARLGYELDRNHLAFIAWFDEVGLVENPFNVLELAITETAESIDLGKPLIHPLGMGAMAGWVGSHGEISEIPAAAGFGPEVGRGVLIAIGEPDSGLDGFLRSHQLAAAARRVAGLTGREPGSLTTYREVAVTALTTVDLDQAIQFAHRRLGELADKGPTPARLRETLVAYLDEGASHGRAAHRLGIHENTVRYRVRQVEETLGRTIDPGDLDLRVALSLASLAGSREGG
ncbi:MAG: helix-turn-helix domain-containing protein [Solirubrobacterales bacterium]|nr:helix-turn-helix domain-containing protein [Solirubrobacterales bacterium]